MTADLIEIVSIFAVLAGACTLVAAAALVSTALAVAVAGAFLVLCGVVGTTIAVSLDRAAKAKAKAPTQDQPYTG